MDIISGHYLSIDRLKLIASICADGSARTNMFVFKHTVLRTRKIKKNGEYFTEIIAYCPHGILYSDYVQKLQGATRLTCLSGPHILLRALKISRPAVGRSRSSTMANAFILASRCSSISKRAVSLVTACRYTQVARQSHWTLACFPRSKAS